MKDRGTALYIASREPQYVRVAGSIRALQARWQLREISSGRARYPQRLLETWWRYLRQRPAVDVKVAGFLGQVYTPLFLFDRTPWVLDAFISLYDSLVVDRRQAGARSPLGRLAFAIDKLAMSKASAIVVDTVSNADHFSRLFGVSRDRFHVVYVGYDNALFRPERRPVAPVNDEDGLEVFFYGSFLPLHGVEHILAAARLLRQEARLRFTIVGGGRRLSQAQEGNSNVRFVEWIPYQQLPRAMARAGICLGGHFGANDKARRTIAGKTFQFMAMAKPTVLGEGPANRELFVDGVHALYCPPADPQALAAALLRLADDPDLRQRLGRGGEQLMRARFNEAAMAAAWEAPLAAAIAARRGKASQA